MVAANSYTRILTGVLFLALSACVTEQTGREDVVPTVAADKRLEAAWGYLAQGNLTQAKRHIDRALEHEPKHSDAHRALAIYFDRIGENDNAEKNYRRAIDLNDKNAAAYSDYGVFLCRNKQHEKAQSMFDKAVNMKSYDNVAGSLENAGLCAKQVGQAERADEFFRRALRINPKQPSALLELGYSEMEKNRVERARQYYQRFLETSNENARSLWLGVQINHALDNKDAVASLALKLERMFPDSEETAQLADAMEKWRK